MKNAKFHKLALKGFCYFDGRHRAEGTLTYFDGSEVPSCKECALKNIKTIRKDYGKPKCLPEPKSQENSHISLVENQENAIIRSGLTQEEKEIIREAVRGECDNG